MASKRLSQRALAELLERAKQGRQQYQAKNDYQFEPTAGNSNYRDLVNWMGNAPGQAADLAGQVGEAVGPMFDMKTPPTPLDDPGRSVEMMAAHSSLRPYENPATLPRSPLADTMASVTAPGALDDVLKSLPGAYEDTRKAISDPTRANIYSALGTGALTALSALPGIGAMVRSGQKSNPMAGVFNTQKNNFEASGPGIGDNEGPPMFSGRDVLDKMAPQMDLPVDQRIQPRPNSQIFDTDWQNKAPWADEPGFAGAYPRPPEGAKKLGKGDRLRPLVDNTDAIAGRLASRIRDSNVLGTPAQYFYHSAGPLYRAAMKSGLTPEQAKLWVKDYAQLYAATSPRTNTLQNAKNASIAMWKRNEFGDDGYQRVLGPAANKLDQKGNPVLNDQGYGMMIGEGGLHSRLIDKIFKDGKLSSDTNPKPDNFGSNVMGHLNSVTADTHAIRGVLIGLNDVVPGGIPEGFFRKTVKGKKTGYYETYLEDPTKFNPEWIDDSLASQKVGKKGETYDSQTEYGPIADIYHKVAEDLGVSPAEAQALSWFGLGDMTNLASERKTLSQIIDDRLDVVAQNMGVSKEYAAKEFFKRNIPLMGLGALGSTEAFEEIMKAKEQERQRERQ